MPSSFRTTDPRAGAPDSTDPARSSPHDKPRALIIDDEPSIREMMAEFLHMEGYSVAIAANGQEGLQLIETWQPSVILLDMRMPVLDGWGFARELRQRGIKLPIVVVSAAPNPRRWADEIGAAAFLSKPFDLEDLLSIIARLCHEPR